MALQEKIQTSLYLEFHLRKKLKRVSKILEVTESSIMESALKDYFQNSKVIQEAQKKIVENDAYLKSVGRTATREISYGNSEGIEFRPQYKEDE